MADCEFKGIQLMGKVQFVDSFPDLKIQYVDAFPDIKVKMVDSFPDKCGLWQKVDAFADFKVQVVTSFPDIKVKLVDSFPGMPWFSMDKSIRREFTPKLFSLIKAGISREQY